MICGHAATVALTYFEADTAWRVALGVGGLPLLLMLFVRSKMPESRFPASPRTASRGTQR